jgi:type IV pilus assembly protein PilN
MQFKINLATRTYINRKKLNLVFASALGLLIFLFLIQIRLYISNSGEIKQLTEMQASLESKTKTKQAAFSEEEYAKVIEEIKFANSIIGRKSFDWIELLNRLENVVPSGVSLTSVAPDTKEGNLKLSGISLNLGKIRQFMEQLEESDYFSDVYLEKQDQAEPNALSFSISCKFAMSPKDL